MSASPAPFAAGDHAEPGRAVRRSPRPGLGHGLGREQGILVAPGFVVGRLGAERAVLGAAPGPGVDNGAQGDAVAEPGQPDRVGALKQLAQPVPGQVDQIADVPIGQGGPVEGLAVNGFQAHGVRIKAHPPPGCPAVPAACEK